MKKRFAALIIALLACLALFVLGACGGGNGNQGGTGSENPSVTPEPDDPGKTPDPETCQHPNATFVYTSEPDCMNGGEKSLTCPDCGKQWTETVGPLGHAYKLDAENTTDATCQHGGTTAYKCERCGADKTEPVPALPHAYRLNEENSHPASCKEAGVEEYVCATCGDHYTVELQKLSHLFEYSAEESTAATCTTAGKEVQICSLCQERNEKPLPALGHKFDGPACTERTCSRADCSAVSPATQEHTYRIVGIEQEVLTEEEALVYCHGNIYDKYVCTECSAEKTELKQAAVQHNVTWAKGDMQLTDPSNCTYEYELTGKCSLCEEDLVQKQTVENNHTYKTVITKVATCSEGGEKDVVCSVCGHTDETKHSKYTDPEAHDWGEGVKSGNVTTFTCSHDGTHQKKSLVAENSSSLKVSNDDLKTVEDVVVNGASIKMDETAKNNLPNGDLTLALDKADAQEAPDVDLEGKTLYSITLSEDGDSFVTDFGGGKVTVRIPYELQDGQDPESIEIWYVDGDELVSMKATYSNGFAVFETGHFSYYTVGIMTPEEMCERYDHNEISHHRGATCTASGYDTVVCSRCGKTLENTVIPAQGHDMQKDETESRAATCDAAGVEVKKCSRCTKIERKTLPKLGHKWVEDKSQAQEANCEHAGKVVYTCENNCGETRETTLPQTAHDFTESVTEATCTAAGYTLYTCKNCRMSYMGGETAPKGHSWNIPEATCTEGQECTVCHAKGQQALGHAWDIEQPTCTQGQTCTRCGEEGKPPLPHSYNDKGYCDVCGNGCSHSYKVLNETESTCEKAGQITSECTICGTQKTEEKPLADHKFDDVTGRCTVCGAVDPERVSEYLELIKTLKADCYTVSLSGAVIDISNKYVEEHITIEDGVGYFSLRDGKLLFRIVVDECTAIVDGVSVETTNIELYSDGDYYYVQYTTNGETEYSRTPVVPEGSEPARTYAIIMQILQDEMFQNYVSELASKNYMLFSTFLEKAAKNAFKRTDDETGYTLTFDRDAMLALNEKLHGETVEGFFDDLFGEEKFGSLVSYLKDILTEKTIKEAADDLLERAEPYHVEKDELFALVDHLVNLVMPNSEQPFSIADYYGGEFGQAHFYEMFGAEKEQLAQMIDQYSAMMRQMTPYELFEQYATGGKADFSLSQILYDSVSALFADNAISLKLRVEGGKAKRLTVKFDDAKLEDLPEETKVSVNGEINLDFGEGKVELKTDDRDGKLLDAIERRIKSSSDGSYTLVLQDFGFSDIESVRPGTRVEKEEVKFAFVGGKLQATVVQTSLSIYDYNSKVGSGYVSTYVIDDLGAATLTVNAGCGNGVSVFAYSASAMYTQENGTFTYQDGEFVFRSSGDSMSHPSTCRFSIGYNEITGSFEKDYEHNYVTDVKNSQTEADVECEQYYTVTETCEKCGKTRTVKRYKSHHYNTRYELKEGGKTCLDGIVEITYCEVCHKDLHRYEMSMDSHFEIEKEYDIETDYGKVGIFVRECVCGMQGVGSRYELASVYLLVDRGDGYEDRAYFSGYGYNVGETLVTANYRYHDRESGNEWRLILSGDVVKEGCFIRTNATATLYLGTLKVGEIQVPILLETEHDFTESSSVTYEESENGLVTSVTTQTTYRCEHGISKTSKVERRYNKNGRIISMLREVRLADGTLLEYEREEFSYDGCNSTVNYFKSPDQTAPEYTDRGTAHEYEFTYELQEGASSCLEGVIEKEVCKYCGDVAYEHTYYEHIYGKQKKLVAHVGEGDIYITETSCPCGERIFYNPIDISYQTRSETYRFEMDHDSKEGPEMRYVCTYGKANISCIIGVTEDNTDPCYTRIKCNFIFYIDNRDIATAEMTFTTDVHHQTEIEELKKESGGEYGPRGFHIEQKVTYKCGHGTDYTSVSEERYDEYNRQTLVLDKRVDEKGNTTYYSMTEYRYGDNCTCTVYRYDQENGEPDVYYNGESHMIRETYELVHEGTSCLQGVRRSYRCAVCGYEDPYSESDVVYEHVWQTKTETLETDEGMFVIEWHECACGYIKELGIISHYHDGMECHLKESEYMGNTYTLACDGPDCGVKATVTITKEDTDPCYTVERRTLTLSGQTYEFWRTAEEHHVGFQEEKLEDTIYSIEKDGFNGYRRSYRYTFGCDHVKPYETIEEVHTDRYGRHLYELRDSFEIDGAQKEYYLYETEYLGNSCEFRRYVTREKDGPRTFEYSDVNHAPSTTEYVLNGMSCEDGVRVTETCPACHKELKRDTYYGHEIIDKRQAVRTESGEYVITFVMSGCACGQEVGSVNWIQWDDQGSESKHYFSLYHDSESKFEDKGTYQLYTYNCAETGCDLKIVEEFRREDVDSCTWREYRLFKVYDGEQLIGETNGYSGCDEYTNHNYKEVQLSEEQYEGGGFKRVTRRQYPCRHVPDETVTESCRCDQYGREIERLYTVVQDGAEEGVYLQYHRETWEYGEKCECLYTDFYSPDGEGYTEHLPAHHAPSEERTHHDATCTQPAYFEWSCPVCGETAYEWDRYWYPLGHSFNGEGKCDYCGLVVPQDANGSIVLEDLSEGEDYKVGVWFRDVSPVDIMTTTRLVYLDGEGDTHEIEVTLDWATAKCPIDFECYIYSLQKALVESAKAAAESSGEYQAGWTYQGLALTFLARFGNENQVITIVLTEEGATVPDAPMQASFLQE